MINLIIKKKNYIYEIFSFWNKLIYLMIFNKYKLIIDFNINYEFNKL